MPTEVPVIKPPTDEPVFNTFRRKPLRPFYSLREVQLGLLSLGLVAAVIGWVSWRGAHPDPHLFVVSEKVLATKGKAVAVYKRPLRPWVEPGAAGASGANAELRLDPFPATVVSAGWRVTAPPQMFDESNLYNKVDGREPFYKSYGFQKLHCLSLAATAQPGLGLDLELFDLGFVQNALGAFSAEISNPDSVTVKQTGTALWYATRNGGFVVQGRYYARLIGSDEQEEVRQKVGAVRAALVAALPGETLPWAYEMFVGRLGFSPAKIQYYAENAFSFGFANDFYAATVPGAETELFLSRRANVADATAIAAKLADGFAGYGQRLPGDGPALFKNSYIESFDGVQTAGVYVMGVRLAPTVPAARKWLSALQTQLENSPKQ